MRLGKRVLSILLIGVLSIGTVIPAQASGIQDKKDKAKKLEQDKAAAEAEKAGLSAQLDKLIADMKKTQEALVKKQDEIAKAADELDAAKIKENDQYEAMKKRIKYMYENGDTEFIEILCDASSISDLLNKAEYISKISTADRRMLQEFQDLVKEIEAKEAALKEEEKELKTLQDTLKKQQSNVEALLKEKNIEIANLESAIGKNAAELKSLIAEAQAAARRQEEANAPVDTGSAGSNVVSGSGQLANPCPGGHMSSNYGPRRAPTAGASTYHRGIDFGASSGTPVYASDGGTVTTVSYNSARGNYIIVNHGGGLQTLYQHLSGVYVNSGAKVSRGQNIGAVGSTGISTGPHLHFEVHVNGSPVNPASYL